MNKPIQYIASALALLTIVAFTSGTVEATSLWTGETIRESSFFVDQPMPQKQVNDIITILIEEASSASTTAETDVDVQDEISGKVTHWFSIENALDLLNLLQFKSPDVTAHPNASANLNNLPAWGMQVGNTFEGDGETLRNNTVVGKVAARVVAVRPNGNLVLEGQRHISINKETNILTITGVARPEDITEGNTILSSMVADLELSLGGKGIISKGNRRGILSHIMSYIR